MKAIANVGPGILKLLDLPLPEPGAGQVRIRTAACGICATDLAMITGWERTPFPAIPGHEWAGSVDALGAGVDGAWVGRRVVADNLWAAGGEVGFEHPGGYDQYFVTEAANLQRLSPGTPCALAALAEPLAVAVHALGRLGQDAPGPVLICGDGPIGLLLLALLRRAGRDDLVLAGGRAGRLALAARWGAAQTIDYHARDLRRQRTGGFGSIVEASGSPAALEAALDIVRPGGRILVLGDYGQARASFTWNLLLHGEIQLTGSNASAGAWPEAVALLAGGGLPLEELITHRLPAERFAEAFALVRFRDSGAIKVLLQWEPG
jgi:2-desacetyl-2-hydroxyethyl bacteriochlorophyllide A dehydrogenase